MVDYLLKDVLVTGHPTIAAIGDQITTQDTPLDVTLDVGDIDTEAASVTVTPISANPALIPSGNIAFSGSGATTRMTLTPLAGAAGSSVITLTANDGAASSVRVTPFNQWRERVFNGVELADLAVSGALADADHDGVVNLLEYGVGSDPNDPTDGPGRVEFIREDVAGVSYPALRFNRLRAELDPSPLISVELATDDFNWRVEPGDTVEVRATPVDETHDQVVIRSTLRMSDFPRQMMRLRFTLQDP